MNITLNDEESREYLNMRDGEIMYKEIQRFLDFLDEVAFRLTPLPLRLYRDGDNYHKEEISWENAHNAIRREHDYLRKKLESLVMKYRKEQK